MAGRPKKENKKIREAVYFEPELLDWLKQKADKQRSTLSIIVNALVAELKGMDDPNFLLEESVDGKFHRKN